MKGGLSTIGTEPRAPTCDGFDNTVRHFRDLLIYRHTQHLNGDPMQLSETEAKPSDVVYFGGNRPIFGFFVC